MNKLFCSKELSRLVLLIVLVFSSSLLANSETFTVTKTADTNDGVCNTDCSLREAIAAANVAVTDDVVEFDVAVFSTTQTITLSGTQLIIQNTGSLTINGKGANLLRISGNRNSRIFWVNNGSIATINGLTITDGNGEGGEINGAGGGIVVSGSLTINNSVISNNGITTTGLVDDGGGIFINNGGLVNINNSTISGNKVRIFGAGISNFGTVNINNSTISDNSASVNGGGVRNAGKANITNSNINNNSIEFPGGGGAGIYNIGGVASMIINNSTVNNNICKSENGGGITNTLQATLVINGSTISNNSAVDNIGVGGGGGIYNNNSTVTITRSLIMGNRATGNASDSDSDGGGGIYVNGGTATLTNSTITNNSAISSRGGGIFNNFGVVHLDHTTVVNNSASSAFANNGSGGGILNKNNSLNMRNSIVADNSDLTGSMPDFVGRLNSQGYNLIENTNGTTINGVTTGNILGRDPQLLPLGNYGGPTQTVALQPTSLAIDAANPGNFSETDQRGVLRPQDGDVNGSSLPDIGAYERQVFAFTVTKTSDTNDGDCNADCSLREAVAAINTATTPDNAIIFDAAVFSTPQVITLSGTGLTINNNGNLTIIGTGANLLTINGNNQVRVLVNLGVLTINDLTITGSIQLAGDGGIRNNGIMTINNSVISGNTANGGGGGGISNIGVLTINKTIISGNTATGTSGSHDGGGGIENDSGILTVTDSVISGNTAAARGGGIRTEGGGRVTINNSTISGNVAFSGGGIYNSSGGTNSTLNLTNTTISGNTAKSDGGGGIHSFSLSLVNLTNVTVANNTALSDNLGTGIGGGARNQGLIFNSRSSIIADNTASGGAPDFSGALTSEGYNLIENASGTTITGITTGNILGVDPHLLPLANYGGLTQTHALQLTSPAIDKGVSSGATTDQRGMPRPFDNPNIPNAPGGNSADIGAFERQAVPQFDFDGDGKSDVSVFRPESGVWHLLQSQSGYAAPQFGLATDKLVPADYDGDGKTDLAVFRENPSDPGKAKFFILLSSNNQFREEQLGSSGDIPVTGDWDGDGKADIGVYRAGTQQNPQGYFYYRPSLQPNVNFIPYPWGIAGDKPVISDYDGDGKADPAVFRPSNGAWYIQRSRDGFYAIQFGASEDKPVVSDYDGDGKADQAVFRPSNGVWYLWNSTAGFSAAQFGVSTDKPVPADYDGDGKTDYAVYRDGNWFILNSTSGFAALGFGNSTDKPIANSFIP